MSAATRAQYDTIVVGGGHNGLVCAAYLARGGRRVLVLEAAARVGGAAVTREFAPGFRASACAHLLHLMPASLMRDLRLEQHGLKFAAERLATVALAADGRHVAFGPGAPAPLAQRAATDAAALARWQQQLERFARALHPVLTETPPRLGTDSWREAYALLGVGWRLRRLGRADLRELLRIGGMPVYDLLEERFRLPLLKGALGLDAVLGTNYGPRSPGTVLSLLYRAAASAGVDTLALPAGGLGALSEALARAATAAGAEVRTGAAVERILVHEDRAAGVALASGEEISARSVVSSADPKRTFLGLLGSEHLDAGFVRRVAQLRSRGLTAKLHLALEHLPQFPGLSDTELRARLVVAPSSDYIERAYNHAKYGEFSSEPALEVTIPTLCDPALAPPGKHVMSVIVQYAPYQLAAGWDGQREAFTARIIATLEAYAPGLRAAIEATELLTPLDIEREFRITGGHWHHAELALDQLLMVRPVPGAAQYHTPVAGLYLCGAGAHPGGGVMGLAGRNAARQLIREAA
ncbi:MAG TPA: NAD(P)/FAD-dependent oxidoreductase [Steroidobacteraceae bacterium]|nr:NAD(P)/FAD-dependent oxidoreductase [Steroidobacteraceae bacterium]